MPTISYPQEAKIIIQPGESFRVTAAGTAQVKTIFGAPDGTVTITAGTQTFGPYMTEAKFELKATAGQVEYYEVIDTPATLPPGAVGNASFDSSGRLLDASGAVALDVVAAQALAKDAAAVSSYMIGATHTEALQAAANSGKQTLLIDIDLTVSGSCVLPNSVAEVVCSKTVIQASDAAIFYRAGTCETTGRPIVSPISIGDGTLSMGAGGVDGLALGDWIFVRSNDLTPNVTAGSRAACIRQVKGLTTNIQVDAAMYRDMSTNIAVYKLELAPSVKFKGGHYKSATQTNRVCLFDFLLCHGPVFDGVKISDSGGAAIRLAHCVGGSFDDSDIYNLRDDEPNSHFGYGVYLGGACRGFMFNSGRVGRVRHAITTGSVFSTSQGNTIATPLPENIKTVIEGKGEPEACFYGPVYVYNTSNAGLDCHEQGYGISITPNVHGCFDGVLIRCSDVNISGGVVNNCRRAGLRLDYASSNPSSSVRISVGVTGTAISNVIQNGSEGYGITVEANGAEVRGKGVRILNPSVAGARTSVEGSKLILVDSDIESSSLTGVGVDLASSGNVIDGGSIKGMATGISERAGVSDNDWSNVRFSGNTTDVSRVPTYTLRGRHNRYQSFTSPLNEHEVPFSYAIAGRYYAAGSFGSVSTSSAVANDNLRASPFYARADLTIDRIGCEVTAAGSAGCTVRLGIYADNGSGYPGALVIDAGTVSGAAVASAEITVNTQLKAGLYWFAAVVQGSPASSPTLRVTNGASFTPGATSLAAALTAASGYGASGVSAALPATFPAGSNVVGLAPRVAVRVA